MLLLPPSVDHTVYPRINPPRQTPKIKRSRFSSYSGMDPGFDYILSLVDKKGRMQSARPLVSRLPLPIFPLDNFLYHLRQIVVLLFIGVLSELGMFVVVRTKQMERPARPHHYYSVEGTNFPVLVSIYPPSTFCIMTTSCLILFFLQRVHNYCRHRHNSRE